MQYWAKSSVIASLLLSGCSLFQAEQMASEKTVANNDGLKIPQGLSAPNRPGQYDIPGGAASAYTEQLVAPMLVLATAGSSRVEENEKLARVWFERSDLTGDLLPFVQQNITDFFSSKGVGLQQVGDLSYQTDWITRSEESGYWLWKSSTAKDQARYELILEPRPHGRSTSLTVKMLEHKYFDAGNALSPLMASHLEVALLNQLINQIAATEIDIAKTRMGKTPDVSLEPGLDADGNPVLITRQSFDVAWNQLEQLFGGLNLEVTDINRSSRTFYLNYRKPERGLWDSLWGRQPKPQLPIADGEYLLVLSTVDAGTALSFRMADGKPLSPQQMVDIYQPIVAAIQEARLEL